MTNADDIAAVSEPAPVPSRLRGRVAIVTGGGHGIGRAYARRLAAEGAEVVIAELDGLAGEEAAQGLCDEGHRCIAVQTDITRSDSLHHLVEEIRTSVGRIDILVNNAAMFSQVPMSRVSFDAISPDEWDRMMEVNLKGTWLACRAVVPTMSEEGYGKIINVSSTTALAGLPTRIHYVTSKAGVIGFTRTLARELGIHGIRVNCIAPGSTLNEAGTDEQTRASREAAVRQRSLPRIQRPDDLAGAVAFFASSDSDFITGQTLVIDGGDYLH